MKKIVSLLLIFSLALTLLASIAFADTEPLPLPEEPRVKAGAAIAYDLTNDEIILEKNMHEKMYPASITKLMTALLLAEKSTPEKDLYISETPLEAPAFAINKNLFILYVGDTVKADVVMKAMLLPSANDMAVVAAEDVGGDVDSFVDMMNEKAKELGMENTNFTNPIGLHDPNHYSTAYDLVKLTAAAYDNDWIRETLATQTANIRTEYQYIGDIENSNILLGQDGNVGGKTGYTGEAGRCLAAVYSRNGREIIQVLLDDGDTFSSTLVFTDMANLANEAYALEKVAMVPADSSVDDIIADYKLFRWFGPEKKLRIKATVADDLMLYNNTIHNTEEGLIPEVTALEDLDVFSLREGRPVADITLRSAGQTLKTQAISQTNTMDSVIIPNAVPYLALAVGLFLLLVVLVIIIVKLVRSRKSTQKKIRSKRQSKRRNITKRRYRR